MADVNKTYETTTEKDGTISSLSIVHGTLVFHTREGAVNPFNHWTRKISKLRDGRSCPMSSD